MLTRFSLYGFFKNQRYFEPFIVLFFLDKGLNFTQIGVLVAFRELFRNLIEIPSGSFADLYGRRFSIIISFSSYLISFILFWISETYIQFFAAMFFFSVADAFRTGTHKAMIFTWLRKVNRIDEKTKVYGFTRSWSKIGSAFSIIVATIIMLTQKDYDFLFLYASIPMVLGLVNILSYPKYLDGDKKSEFKPKELFIHFISSLKKSIRLKPLRKLMTETMSYEGMFTAFKDYIQPLINSFAIAAPFLIEYEEKSRTAVIVGIIYLALYLISAWASRKSHIFANKFNGEKKGTKKLWQITSVSYLALIPLLFYEIYIPAIILFILLNLLQNFWRPMQISRFDDYANEEEGAAILSIESQAKSFATMLLAPLFGFTVDLTNKLNFGSELWIVALLCFGITLLFTFRKN